MATEQDKANLTLTRGRQAAQIADPKEKKAYIADSANVDKDYEGTANATAIKGNELQRRAILGSMHKGGPVKADGAYNLKAGEHVLTASEAANARKHALMASGMKSLAKPSPKVGKPTASMTITPMPKTTATDKTLASPVKPGMPTMSISPSPKAGLGWKAQSAIAHPGDTTRPTASDVVKT